MNRYYEIILKGTENRASKALDIQVLDKQSRFYGGFSNEYDVVMAKFSVYKTMSLMTVFLNRDSKYYQDVAVYQRILLGLSFVEKKQKSTGLFDYETCNFESTPDTAFMLKKMLPVYQYLAGHRADEKHEIIFNRLETIIKNGMVGLLSSGFHTPNHRWVIASILAYWGFLKGEKSYIEAARKYLVEGIDCNGDGEFAERSAGNYNRINDDAMVWLSQGLGDEQYEGHAISNLTMMMRYYEPDGSIFTGNSTRFDKDLKIYPRDYFWLYYTLGNKHANSDFLGMANRIIDISEQQKLGMPDCLIYFMNEPKLGRLDIEEIETYQVTDTSYSYFDESAIGRFISPTLTCTVLGNKHNFLYINDGHINLEMKFCGSFFEHRGFKASKINYISQIYTLTQTQKGWYYLPFEDKQSTADWWQMDHSQRPIKAGPNIDYRIIIEPTEEKTVIHIKANGVVDAPFRVEIALSGIDTIETSSHVMPVTGVESLLVKEGLIIARSKKTSISIGPGFAEHKFIVGKEDSDVKHPGIATIYFTDYLPMERTIVIKSIKSMD